MQSKNCAKYNIKYIDSFLQAIHPNINCAEYQENLKLEGMNDDERSLFKMDEIVKNNLGMRCPTCKVSIKWPLQMKCC